MYLLAFVTMIVQGSQMGSRVLATLFALELQTSKWTIGLLIAAYSFLPLLLAIYAGLVDMVDNGVNAMTVVGCLPAT